MPKVNYQQMLNRFEDCHRKLSHNLLMPGEVRSNGVMDVVGSLTPDSLTADFSKPDYVASSGLDPELAALCARAFNDSKARVASLTNVFICLQGNFSWAGPQFERTSMFDHYHPPRPGKNRCQSSTYFIPIEGDQDSEKFHYYDLKSLGYQTPYYKDPEHLVGEYRQLTSRVPDWKLIDIPVDRVTRLDFCSSRWFHGVRDFRNIFLVIVMNDVEFHSPIDESVINVWRGEI